MSIRSIARLGANYLHEAGGVGTVNDVMQALRQRRLPAPDRTSMQRYLNAAVSEGFASMWPGDRGTRAQGVYLIGGRR